MKNIQITNSSELHQGWYKKNNDINSLIPQNGQIQSNYSSAIADERFECVWVSFTDFYVISSLFFVVKLFFLYSKDINLAKEKHQKKVREKFQKYRHYCIQSTQRCLQQIIFLVLRKVFWCFLVLYYIVWDWLVFKILEVFQLFPIFKPFKISDVETSPSIISGGLVL